jgi:hypothetical protein
VLELGMLRAVVWSEGHSGGDGEGDAGVCSNSI